MSKGPLSITKRITLAATAVTAAGGKITVTSPVPGRIEEIQIIQANAGAVHVDLNTLQVTRVRGGAAQALLSTAGKLTLAAGHGVGISTSKKRTAIPTPAGCTKPVLNGAYVAVRAGDSFELSWAANGAPNPWPTLGLAIIVKPDL